MVPCPTVRITTLLVARAESKNPRVADVPSSVLSDSDDDRTALCTPHTCSYSSSDLKNRCLYLVSLGDHHVENVNYYSTHSYRPAADLSCHETFHDDHYTRHT